MLVRIRQLGRSAARLIMKRLQIVGQLTLELINARNNQFPMGRSSSLASLANLFIVFMTGKVHS